VRIILGDFVSDIRLIGYVAVKQSLQSSLRMPTINYE